MRCLTDEEIEAVRVEARRATVQAVIAILRRRSEASTTFAVERDLLRAAGEIEALLASGPPTAGGVPR